MARARPSPFRPLVAYATNVHRGETLAEVYRFLRDYTLPVKRRTCPGAAAGLELYERCASWGRAPWVGSGGYAVSVHRRPTTET